jgi:hypothetical protein
MYVSLKFHEPLVMSTFSVTYVVVFVPTFVALPIKKQAAPQMRTR